MSACWRSPTTGTTSATGGAGDPAGARRRAATAFQGHVVSPRHPGLDHHLRRRRHRGHAGRRRPGGRPLGQGDAGGPQGPARSPQGPGRGTGQGGIRRVPVAGIVSNARREVFGDPGGPEAHPSPSDEIPLFRRRVLAAGSSIASRRRVRSSLAPWGTSRSPPVHRPGPWTIRRKVEICMSDCFSSFDRLGLFDTKGIGDLPLALARQLPDLTESSSSSSSCVRAAARVDALSCWSSGSRVRRMTWPSYFSPSFFRAARGLLKNNLNNFVVSRHASCTPIIV